VTKFSLVLRIIWREVDFEKAYDSVDWGFLKYMMKRLGLCVKWVAWMRACIF